MNELQRNLLAIAKEARQSSVDPDAWRPFPHPSVEEFALYQGKWYKPESLTEAEYDVVLAAAETAKCVADVKFRPQDSFLNAQMLVLQDPCLMLSYVEGYFWMPEFEDGVLNHAWAEINGKVVDLTARIGSRPKKGSPKFSDRVLGTFPEGYQYLGVRIYDRRAIREWILAQGDAAPMLEHLWQASSLNASETTEQAVPGSLKGQHANAT